MACQFNFLFMTQNKLEMRFWRLLFFFFGTISFFTLQAQTISVIDTLKWEDQAIAVESQGLGQLEIWQFKGAVFRQDEPEIPRYHTTITLPEKVEISSAYLTSFQEKSLGKISFKGNNTLKDDYQIEYFVTKDRNTYLLNVIIAPFRQSSGSTLRLETFQMTITYKSAIQSSSRSSFKSNSILANPGFYKLAIPETGIYKIDADVLRKVGINPDQVNPKNIRIFAARGGMLPEANSATRVDDLEELSIMVLGESDQKFDVGDFVLFYGQGPEQITFNSSDRRVQQSNSIYENVAYVFINVNLGPGKRITDSNTIGTSTYTSRYFDDWKHFEQDLVNIGHISPYTTGAGKQWYGDNFRIVREKNYSGIFNFSDRDWVSPVHVESVFAGRASQVSRFHLDINGRTFSSSNMGSTNLGNPYSPYSRKGRIS